MRLIDADALKAVFRKEYKVSFTDAIDEVIDAQPTVEERKKGKWMTSYLDHEAMGIRPKILYCSKCCQCIAYPTNFCPNCGADMKGEQDG